MNNNFKPSYIGKRSDIEKLLPPNAKTVLDVGCSTGALGASIKTNTGAIVWGIELSKDMAKKAEEHLDGVIVGDAEAIFLQKKLGEKKFDVIIFADILEHLVDPWTIMKTATSYLKPGGSIITSIPNIRHIDTIYNLLIRGRWPYRNRGIHDWTHLRFFTKKNILELFENTQLTIDSIEANYRIIEKPHGLNRIAKYIAAPGIRNFLAFQYLVRATKQKDA